MRSTLHLAKQKKVPMCVYIIYIWYSNIVCIYIYSVVKQATKTTLKTLCDNSFNQEGQFPEQGAWIQGLV